MAKRTWYLEDVEEAAQRSETFFIPARVDRCALRVGELVRLHFMLSSPPTDGPRAERMWVEIESLDDEGSYRGYLTNRPTAINDLKPGDLIDFSAEHVARLFIPKDDPRWYANMERSALVSESVFEDCCRWIFHQSPDRKEDSGWRLFSGTETEEQLEDPRRVRICNVAWLCDFDPSLAELLRTEVDTAFERNSRDDPWNQATEWSPPD
jgi:hypothetical protein